MNRFFRSLFRPAPQGTIRNPRPTRKTRLGLEDLAVKPWRTAVRRQRQRFLNASIRPRR